MDKQDKSGLRNKKIQSIKESLRKIPIISKNTFKVEEKIKTFNEQKCSPERKVSHHGDDLKFRSLEQIQQSTLFDDKYDILETIGEGANGFVNKCKKIKTGRIYAVKSSMMDEEHIIGLKENFLAIHSLNHPNIVEYHALYIDMRKKLCSIVMEYINLPSLQKVKIHDQQQLKKIIHQLLDSVKYLHEKNISHRDFKPQNILYDEKNKTIKIIDFGTSRNFIRRNCKLDMLTITGTLYYRAPEMFSGGGYDQKVDIWAVGILIYKLICGKTPFESIYLSDTINNIKEQPLKFEEQIWSKTDPALKNLIKRMLKKDTNNRLTASQCLRDIWFYSLTINQLVDWTQSYNELPSRLESGPNNKKSLDKSKKNIENVETMTEVRKNIDGEDCFFFDSEEATAISMSTGKINLQKEEIKKILSGSMIF